MKNFKPNDNFIYYLYFIVERQNIFWKRYRGESPPYTEDEILKSHKFTNVYKCLDRSTQFEFSNVIYNSKTYTKEDMFYRILIYKHFNLPQTWELLERNLGDIKLGSVSFNDISNFLVDYQNKNKKFTPYSNAYMLTAAFLAGNKGKYVHLKGNGWKKYQYYFHIFENEIFSSNNLHNLLESNSLSDLYYKLLKITSFAEFLSYQFIIDFNYSEIFNFNENSFAIAGLGTRRGVDRTIDFEGKPDYEAVIYWVQSNLEQLLEDYSNKFDIKLDFTPLPNRMPTNVDLSNCFCETDKLLRGLGVEAVGKNVHGKRLKNTFTPQANKINYSFPPKWSVNLK